MLTKKIEIKEMEIALEMQKYLGDQILEILIKIASFK